MISEHEEQSIAAAYKEMGFHEGRDERGRGDGEGPICSDYPALSAGVGP